MHFLHNRCRLALVYVLYNSLPESYLVGHLPITLLIFYSIIIKLNNQQLLNDLEEVYGVLTV